MTEQNTALMLEHAPKLALSYARQLCALSQSCQRGLGNTMTEFFAIQAQTMEE